VRSPQLFYFAAFSIGGAPGGCFCYGSSAFILHENRCE
jgi:hypothetical protein